MYNDHTLVHLRHSYERMKRSSDREGDPQSQLEKGTSVESHSARTS